jgi:hypothetical protein
MTRTTAPTAAPIGANKLTAMIINHIYSAGGYAWRAQSSGLFDRAKGSYRSAPKVGVSDVMACWRGRMVAIEIKIGKDSLRPEQVGFMANVIHAGGAAFVAKTFPEFLKEWDHLTKTSPALK